MLSTFEIILGRPRCRNWIPLVTQQLRLRHLVRVIAYNMETVEGSVYYTLHLTTMCAPFYTSERLQTPNPKWAELDVDTLQFSSATGIVVRIWKECIKNGDCTSCMDTVTLTWGVYFSGLVYLGTKLADIQPVSFKPNTIIFQLNGGYFTSFSCLLTDSPKPLPFNSRLNVRNDSIVRFASVRYTSGDVRSSYSVRKLQTLHQLQQAIKNRTLDAHDLREKISGKQDGKQEREEQTAAQPRLLSMMSINRILNKQEQPTRVQRQEIIRLRKLIESARFRTKLLGQERDRKLANLRRLNQQCNDMLDNNEDKNSELMSLYRHLSRDMERLREWKRTHADVRELYVHTSAQLYLCRKQLIEQLQLIYPIEMTEDNRYTICGVCLPDSENLNSVPENSLSVALGYVTHVVVMCAAFLQTPLRYPLVHLGSRSKIQDHITHNIPDREREFPLYTKGKDRLQFHYAVYLLNKNVAQLRWFCGLSTQDLRATLPNLLTLLHGKLDYRHDRFETVIHASVERGQMAALSTSTNNSSEQLFTPRTPVRKISRTNVSESGPGLSQILKTPQKVTIGEQLSVPKTCVDCNIEQGMDIVDTNSPNSPEIQCQHSTVGTTFPVADDDIKSSEFSDSSLPNSLGDGRREFLQHWFNSNTSALVSSNENLCADDILTNDQITVRTDALVQKNTTFHLVKPKH